MGYFWMGGKIPQSTAFQGLPAFRLHSARISARHSQTTRATNCATPGYLIFAFRNFLCLWSFLWSKAISRRVSGGEKSPQTEALQGFPASVRDAVRIPSLRSQKPTAYQLRCFRTTGIISYRGIKEKRDSHKPLRRNKCRRPIGARQ